MSGANKALEERVAQLEAIVQKQQSLLAKTGEQMLKLSVQQQRSDVGDLDRRNKDLRQQAKLDPAEGDADYFSQDDVVVLVEELQAQLDLVDKRSQLRLENSYATEGSDKLSAIPDLAGETYPGQPATVDEFKQMAKADIIAFARFYELLPPDSNEIREMLAESQIPLTSAEGKKALETAEAAEAKLEENDVFNTLARYIGVSTRK